MKKNLLLSACLVTLFFLSATAQVKCEWGNIDTRYAVEKGVVLSAESLVSTLKPLCCSTKKSAPLPINSACSNSKSLFLTHITVLLSAN